MLSAGNGSERVPLHLLNLEGSLGDGVKRKRSDRALLTVDAGMPWRLTMKGAFVTNLSSVSLHVLLASPRA